MNKVIATALAAIFIFWFCGVLVGAEVPAGFRFDDRSGVTISGEIAKMINVETRAFERDRHIAAYDSFLNETELTKRIWGACALGHFQSSAALDALFRRTGVESSDLVINEIYNSLLLNFEIYGVEVDTHSDIDARSKKKRITEWKAAYEELGYQGLVLRGWAVARKRGGEGVDLFIAGITGRYDPHLVSSLLTMRLDNINKEANDQIERTILCWSGYDCKQQSVSEMTKELQSESSLSPDSVCARYVKYFERIGYSVPPTSRKEVALAVLFAQGDKKNAYLREMALRMLSCPIL